MFNEIDLKNIKKVPLSNRKRKVDINAFAKLWQKGGSLPDFISTLPDILKVKDLKGIISAIGTAKEKNKPIVLMFGGHVVKCGLGPIIIDLCKRNTITAVAMNSAASFHDFELAIMGETSEDVDKALSNGTFGMMEKIPDDFNNAINEGFKLGLGFGEALGKFLMETKAEFAEISILYNLYKMQKLATVHAGIGTDIAQQHSSANGEAIGETSYRDFKRLANIVCDIGDGGVVLNVGSAVILPEVFLKCLSIARNLRGEIANFTTVNLDMNRHYRTTTNILKRPVSDGGSAFEIIGHHEIMLPLIASCLIENL